MPPALQQPRAAPVHVRAPASPRARASARFLVEGRRVRDAPAVAWLLLRARAAAAHRGPRGPHPGRSRQTHLGVRAKARRDLCDHDEAAGLLGLAREPRGGRGGAVRSFRGATLLLVVAAVAACRRAPREGRLPPEPGAP